MKTFLSIFFTGTLITFGQSLVVSEGSSISINSNSSVSVDGLALAPS